MKRLLVPVVRLSSSQRVIDLLISKSSLEMKFMAFLLHVEVPATQWQWPALMGGYATKSRNGSPDLLFDTLLGKLERHGIDCCAYIRSGGVVFTILDTAEELDCNAIVMPPPAKGIKQFWSRNIVQHVMKRQRKVPVMVMG